MTTPAHAAGCDEQHNPRQRCNVPAPIDAHFAPCPTCGAINDDDPVFCASCGQRLRGKSSYPALPAVVPRPAPRLTRSATIIALIAELLPLGAVVAAFAYVIGFVALNQTTGYEPPRSLAGIGFLLLFALSCAGGLGWISSGKTGMGCAIGAIRAATTIAMFGVTLAALLSTGGDDHGVDTEIAVWALILLTFNAIMPMATSCWLAWDLSHRKQSRRPNLSAPSPPEGEGAGG